MCGISSDEPPPPPRRPKTGKLEIIHIKNHGLIEMVAHLDVLFGPGCNAAKKKSPEKTKKRETENPGDKCTYFILWHAKIPIMDYRFALTW